MIKVMFTMPWTQEWTFEMSTVPRVGEHVDVDSYQYRVSQVLYYPTTDCVRIRLETL